MFNFRRRPTTTNTVITRKRFLRKLYLSRMQLSLGLLIIFSLLVLYTVFLSGVFKVHTIKLIPAELHCASSDKIKENLPRGRNILFIDTAELTAILRTKFPCLYTVEVRKQLPDTLSISIAERAPVLFLKVAVVAPEAVSLITPEASSSSQSAVPVVQKDDFLIDENAFSRLYAVDSEGVVLLENPEFADVPILYYESEKELEINQIIDKTIVQNSLGILKQLKERGISVSQAKISSDSLYILGESKYVFMLKKDLDRQVISLQLILQKAKIDSVSVDKVDLRFDKPVVVYRKKN